MEELAIINCSKCSSPVAEHDKFCNECGFPENGSQKEKELYDYRIKLKMDVVEEAQKKLKNVKVLLYVIAGLNFAIGAYFVTTDTNIADGLFNMFSAAIYLACVIWVNKQPLTGVLAAFVFWIVTQLLLVLVDPALLFNGIILKAVFIGIFIKGISSANDVKKYTAQLKDLKAI